METLAPWAAKHACAVHTLYPRVRERLEKDGLASLFDEVEMPLTGVLARVERNGVRVDEERVRAPRTASFGVAPSRLADHHGMIAGQGPLLPHEVSAIDRQFRKRWKAQKPGRWD